MKAASARRTVSGVWCAARYCIRAPVSTSSGIASGVTVFFPILRFSASATAIASPRSGADTASTSGGSRLVRNAQRITAPLSKVMSLSLNIAAQPGCLACPMLVSDGAKRKNLIPRSR